VRTLEEFLTEREEMERGRADEKIAVQKEWIGAVRRLIDQMTEWLRAADKKHLLEIEETQYKLREVDVGVYRVPGLVIWLEANEVRIVPIARMVVGPELSNGIIRVTRSFGRVDITDGGEKFMLFRSQKDPSDEWVIVEDRAYTFKRFDREAFEEATQSLLQ
jgi:hypothetical protein